VPVNETDPTVLRRLETRLLVRDTSGAVYGASYKWRADNSDADLVNAGITEDITIKTAAGSRVQKWFYPGRQDCLTCHTPISGGVLGVNTRQLNGDFTYPSTRVRDNQLRTWSHLALFDKPLEDKNLPLLPKLVNVTNNLSTLNARVRSYLDANCSHCHQPGGAGAFFDARFDTPLARQNLINGPVQNPLGIAGAKVVVPDDTNKSVLFHRVSMIGQNQMPPIAKNVVDDRAVAVMAKWISSMHAVTASLPRTWSDVDIGDVGIPGEASYLRGQFNLIATGSDIWESADSFHYSSRPLTGDGQIVARMVSMLYTDPWAKAGIMFRETAAAGAKYAFMGFTGQGGSVLQSRAQTDNGTLSTDGPPAKIPHWMKLVRTGDAFVGFISVDGKVWEPVGSIIIPMKKAINVGLALASHNNAVVNSTLFDNVTVTAGSRPAPLQ
jgi:mono/diheme cytochrome c family protein/regulation of enolase protein 1 (concanavalin A-like superfamily)